MEEKVGWKDIDFKKSCEKIPLNKFKIKQKDYLPTGNFPVVDQGQELIGGYYDDPSHVVPGEPPFIIFGDHTKVKKYINFNFVAGADGVKVLKPNSFYNPKLLFYFIHSIKIPDKGYARHFQHLDKSIIPVPPLPEQHAIVSKIEQLSSDLDNGISNLKMAQEQLKVYRQAVLKKAFEGELTRVWREQQTNLPDAENLLEQIRVEREENYNRSLDEWKTTVKEWEDGGKQGKKPSRPQKIKKIETLTEAELSDLGKLTTGWSWVKIGDVSNCLDKQRVPVNKSERLRRVGDIPYYGANGQVGWIDDYLFDETLVLVVEDETFTGREKPFSYIIKGKSWVNNHAHVLQATVGLNVDFLNYQLSYYPFTPLTTGTTGRKKLTQLALINAPFKICSLLEQQAIVTEIETRISVCDKVEQDIEENLERAEALRQSILKKAFEGKLLNERELEEVHNAPDWEPAEALLGRIKTEKANKK